MTFSHLDYATPLDKVIDALPSLNYIFGEIELHFLTLLWSKKLINYLSLVFYFDISFHDLVNHWTQQIQSPFQTPKIKVNQNSY